MGAEVLLVIKKLSKRIEREVFRLRRMEDLIKRTNKELDGMPKAQNHESIIEKLTAGIIDAKNLVNHLLQVRTACRLELIDLLEKLLGDYFEECQTLILRYAYEFFFTTIQTRLCYSRASIYRFHRNGLARLGLSPEDIHTLENYDI